MSNNDTAQKVLESLDKEELQSAMLGVVSSLLSGQTPETVDVRIMMKVPKPIFDMVNKICAAGDIDMEDVFSEMASGGFKQQLEGLLQTAHSVEEEVKETEPVLDLGDVAPQLDELKQGLSQFMSLAGQLTNIQEAFGNASGNTNTPEPQGKKNTK